MTTANESAFPKEGQPIINWIKMDPSKHNQFSEGDVYLIALRTGKNGGPYTWEIDRVKIFADDGKSSLVYECGCSYDSWSWDDVEYFSVVEGSEPTNFGGETG